MKKFTKVILIVALALIGVGAACTIAAFALGITWDALDEISIRRPGGASYSARINKDEDDILPKVEISVDGVSGTKKMEFDGIRNLNIESGAAAIRIYYAPVEKTEVHYDSAVGMSAEMDDGRDLDIECGFSTAGTVDVLIPEGTALDEIDLDIGAGQVLIENVHFKKLDADVGAGELVVDAPDVKSSYNYQVDCGLGEIIIGDERYAGITSTERQQGAEKTIDIACGAGKVEIRFAE